MMNSQEARLRNDLAAAFRWTVRLGLHEVPQKCHVLIAEELGGARGLPRSDKHSAVVLVVGQVTTETRGVVVGSFWFPRQLAADVLELNASGAIDLSTFRAECFGIDQILAAMKHSVQHSGGLRHVALKP